MSLQKLITNNTAYNLWANKQFVTWLAEKPHETLLQEVASSYSGILKTLNHIWGVEEYWYAIITNNEQFEQRFGVEATDANEIFQGLINRSTLLAEKVKTFTEAELSEKVKVVSPWFESDLPRYEYIQHLINHSTYHRGQIVTIGRIANITDAPMTDYNAYNVMKQTQLQ